MSGYLCLYILIAHDATHRFHEILHITIYFEFYDFLEIVICRSDYFVQSDPQFFVIEYLPIEFNHLYLVFDDVFVRSFFKEFFIEILSKKFSSFFLPAVKITVDAFFLRSLFDR